MIHLALVAGVSFFLIVTYIQSQKFSAQMEEGDSFIYLVPTFAILGYFGSQFIFNRIVTSLNKKSPQEEKLKKYQTATIIKYALLEAPAFFAIVAYSITGNALSLVIAICLILYLIVRRPNKERVMNTLPLHGEEKRKIELNNK